MDFQRERLKAAIRERNQTMRAVSTAMGRNKAYVQQFFENDTPKELSERDRARAEKFLGLSDGYLRNPSAPLSAKTPTGTKPSNEALIERAQSGQGAKTEEAMDALTIGIERLLDKYGYRAVANKVEELEAERRAHPHQRRA